MCSVHQVASARGSACAHRSLLPCPLRARPLRSTPAPACDASCLAIRLTLYIVVTVYTNRTVGGPTSRDPWYTRWYSNMYAQRERNCKDLNFLAAVTFQDCSIAVEYKVPTTSRYMYKLVQ